MAALREHRTQVTRDGPFFEMAETSARRRWAVEYFSLARAPPGPRAVDADGWETDLFDGLD